MNAPLVEGEDYVWEDGRMVFTAAFLLKRGFCCNSGCRNCPYRERDSDPETVRIEMPGPGKKR